MSQGSCLCGGIKFEIEEFNGPFELCHCKKCRKVSGSAFLAGIYAKKSKFHFLQGTDLIKSFTVPIENEPPGYQSSFCGVCGSPVPNIQGDSPTVEIPAGLLDEEPAIHPDKHIFVESKSSWYPINDNIPQMDKKTLYEHRSKRE